MAKRDMNTKLAGILERTAAGLLDGTVDLEKAREVRGAVHESYAILLGLPAVWTATLNVSTQVPSESEAVITEGAKP